MSVTQPDQPAKVVIRVRMSDADRDEYGGPEWVEYDHAIVEDMRASERIEIETTIGMSIPSWIDALAADIYAAQPAKALLWLARRQAGLVDDWAKFDPHVARRHLTIREHRVPLDGGDADPPASSPAPSTESGSDSSPTTPEDSAPATG